MENGLTWLVSGGGAAIVTYWLMQNWKVLSELPPRWKRMASLLLPAPFAAVGYAVAIWMQYITTPVGGREWCEVLFGVMSAAVLQQGIHGVRKLK